MIVNLMSRKTIRLQITQDTNKNYKLILFISVNNTVKNGIVLINNSHWGELRPGCNANRLEKFMLFFGMVLFYLRFGVSGSILRVIYS